jgi:hypothetical protein
MTRTHPILLKRTAMVVMLSVSLTGCTKTQITHAITKSLESTCEAHSDQCSCDNCDTVPTKTHSQH